MSEGFEGEDSIWGDDQIGLQYWSEVNVAMQV